MRFEQLADDLDEIALHLRLEDRGFQANQYRKASESLRKADFIPPDPSQLPDVGEAIRDDIAEYRAYGEIERLNDMRDKRPYLSELTRISKVGPKTAETLHQETGASSINDVKELVENGELEDVSGIGPKTAKTIRRSVAQLKV